jgi:hypothetical protein
VAFARAPGLARLAVEGRELELPDADDEPGGWQSVSLHGPPREGLALDLTLETDAELEIVLAERRAALPREAASLLGGRPPEVVPAHWGDHVLLVERLTR